METAVSALRVALAALVAILVAVAADDPGH
jgi:hypothetical protein